MSTAFVESATDTGIPDHPLTPLSAEEIRTVRRIVDEHGLLGGERPVRLRRAGGAAQEDRAGVRPRRPDRTSGPGCCYWTGPPAAAATWWSRLTQDKVLTVEHVDAGVDGHVPILDQEFEDIEAVPAGLPGLADRHDPSAVSIPTDVRAVPLSAGVFGHEDEVGRRIVRVLAFYQYDAADLPWAHPIDGVVAYVDLTARRVTKVIDEIELPAARRAWTVGRRTARGGAPHRSQAHRDHPARGAEFHRRGQPDQLGGLEVPVRLRRARGPHPAPAVHRRPPGGLPGLDRRDGGALRRPVTGAVLAELLRPGRVPVRPVHQLP